VESPFRGESEVREEHAFFYGNARGGGFPIGEVNWMVVRNRVVF